MKRQRIVLVGAGHVHMHVIRHAPAFHAAGVELSVVETGNFRYAGHAFAALAGTLSQADQHINLARYCNNHDVVLHRASAVGLAHRHRRLWLASGQKLEYDALSLNVGSEIDEQKFERRAAQARIWPLKPLHNLVQLHSVISAARERGEVGTIVVVGAGASGCEVAASLAALVMGSRMQVMLISAAARVWPQAPPAAARRVMRALAARGVDIVLQTRVDGCTGRAVYTSDGRHFRADHVVLATGLRVPRLIHASGLPCTQHGLRVGPRLYAPRDRRVFAVGDCADTVPQSLPLQLAQPARLGAILAHNLLAGLLNRPYRTIRMRRHPTMFLDLADGNAIVCRGRFWWHGRTSLACKRRRDHAFLTALRC